MTLIYNPYPRSNGMICNLPGTGTVLIGGKTTANINNGYLNTVDIFNGTSWTASSATIPKSINGLSGRSDATLFYDGTVLVLANGTDGISNLSQIFSFNGTSFTDITPTETSESLPFLAPSLLRSSNAIYQSGSSLAYMFAGRTSYERHYNKDLWSYSHSGGWSFLPTTTPSARCDYGFASSSSTAILFGGKNFDGANGETWQLASGSWTQLFPTTSPSKRYGCSMAYSTTDSAWYLFGGITANNYSNKLWKYDGTNWSNITPAVSPNPRAFASMAYNSGSNKIILFGGQDYLGDYNDSWTFSSGAWTQL